jgi:hypothetical protein
MAMEQLMNMEYSLYAILYLVDLQIMEKRSCNNICYKETYPFCNGVEYKKEVLELLVKYNNENLNRILKNHYSICEKIIEKWDNQLRFMSGFRQDIGFWGNDYDIYCEFKQDISFPFKEITLLRNDDTYGNPYIETNRYWITKDYPHGRFFYKKSTIILFLVTFVNNVKGFLHTYSGIVENLQTIEQHSHKKVANRFIRTFTTDEQKKLFNGLISGGFLPKETNYNHFCYVFGGTPIPDDEKPFERLMWKKPKSQALFAYFVYQLFSETDIKFWDISAQCFTIWGKEPNIGAMKTEQSKVKNEEKDPPKGSNIVDEIIMNMATA